ncbi:MAG TPA: hypothetical protein VLB83_01625 [Candidatus Paceibacterota bacterium]|nr:hypothetical protein [Candidatus Paceibacterota bacterium]
MKPEFQKSEAARPPLVDRLRSHVEVPAGAAQSWAIALFMGACALRAVLWVGERALPAYQTVKIALEIWWVSAIASMTVATTLQIVLYGALSGIALTLMVASHEYGHLFGFWRRGCAIPKIWFIPFVGAIMRFAARTHDPAGFNHRYGLDEPETAAYIGFMGPFAGTVATATVFIVWLTPASAAFIPDALRDPLRGILIGSALYNLVQLSLAVRPFDGGWITQAIHPWFRHYTMGMLAFLTFAFHAAWVAHWWALFFYGIRFTRAWRRMLAVGCVALIMCGAIALGYGRASTLENAIDIGFMGVILWWTYGLVRGSGEPFHALPEWRALLWTVKKPTGRWKDRSSSDGEAESDLDAERRLAAALRIPADAVPHAPYSGEDRRGSSAIPIGIRFKWAFCYLGLVGTLFFLLGMILLARA